MTLYQHHQISVHSTPDSVLDHCKFCGTAIQHYPSVGWIDTTPPFNGGTYDMCDSSGLYGAHEPLPAPKPKVKVRL